jgi:hypothetical protein
MIEPLSYHVKVKPWGVPRIDRSKQGVMKKRKGENMKSIVFKGLLKRLAQPNRGKAQ